MANTALKSVKILLDVLNDIYKEHGLYGEKLISVARQGRAGAAEIQQLMTDYRTRPPVNIAGSEVVKVIDYQEDGTGLPKSNVLQFFLADGARITARPSGTEPKIKYYISVKANDNAAVEQRINEIIAALGL